MTNNPTIDGVSRDAFKWAIQQLEEDGHKGCGYFDSLRAILDTPAVERQEPVAEVVATGGPHDKEDRVLVELQAELPAIGTKIYAAPPEVAALQSTIARLEARITQLESEKEFAAATYQAARDRIAELESEEPEWSAMQQRLGDENAQLRSRIAELESGLGGMLFAFDDGVGRGWSEKLLDYARQLTPAVEFDATAALNWVKP